MPNSEVSLEELLGLTPPKTPPSLQQQASSHQSTQEATKPPATQQQEETPLTGYPLKQFTRRQKVFAYRCKGYTIPQICKKLKENEDITVSEHTVWNDLHSDQASDLIDELIRLQLQDIEDLEKPVSKLHWRDIVIERLMPRKAPVEVNVNTTAQASITSEVDQIINFSREHNADSKPQDPTAANEAE